MGYFGTSFVFHLSKRNKTRHLELEGWVISSWPHQDKKSNSRTPGQNAFYFQLCISLSPHCLFTWHCMKVFLKDESNKDMGREQADDTCWTVLLEKKMPGKFFIEHLVTVQNHWITEGVCRNDIIRSYSHDSVLVFAVT